VCYQEGSYELYFFGIFLQFDFRQTGLWSWNLKRISWQDCQIVIFKPKIPIWVNFGGPRLENILWPFRIFYGHLGYLCNHRVLHFVLIWKKIRFWYHVPRKIWQPRLLDVSGRDVPKIKMNFSLHCFAVLTASLPIPPERPNQALFPFFQLSIFCFLFSTRIARLFLLQHTKTVENIPKKHKIY
jgi:hypothetical protein